MLGREYQRVKIKKLKAEGRKSTLTMSNRSKDAKNGFAKKMCIDIVIQKNLTFFRRKNIFGKNKKIFLKMEKQRILVRIH